MESWLGRVGEGNLAIGDISLGKFLRGCLVWRLFMKTPFTILALCLLAAGQLSAQFGVGDVPVEITADGGTRFEAGQAVAEDNVFIQYDDVFIYCDFAQYNPDTRDVLLKGRVRVYRDELVFSGERAVYNFDTQRIRAADFTGGFDPFLAGADELTTISAREFRLRDTFLTTHDSSRPDFRLRARTVRLYPDDRVIFSNVSLVVGETPIFWWPYLYQSLREDAGFYFIPGYRSNWGAFLLTQYSFPLTTGAVGTLHVDLRSQRGLGLGFDTRFEYGEDNRSKGLFRSYLAFDSSPQTSRVSGADRTEAIPSQRYRVSFEHRAYLTDDLYANFNINVLSDRSVLEDFFPAEFRVDPQPDNVVSLTQWGDFYTITGIVRAQLNDFFETTERLPEVVLDIKRHGIFGSPIFYEGETSVGHYKRAFAEGSDLPDYDLNRFDTFHQLLYPRTYFDWLSVIPRIGFRGTYYSQTGRIQRTEEEGEIFTPTGPQPTTLVTNELVTEGSDFRPVFNAGLETSFKFSRPYEAVQSRRLGLDGLWHVVQPYGNMSYVSNAGIRPEDILQIDQLIPSTEIPPIDFPQFTSIDSIDNWSILRLGVRNRLLTRRDDRTMNWLDLDTFFDVNFDNPYSDATFSNVVNRLRWNPLPWFTMRTEAQLPILDDGFTEINTSLNFTASRFWQASVGHRFLDGNPFFQDSNLVTFGSYFRIDDNWGFSFYEQIELEDGTLEIQRYSLHRDLSSWVASLSAVIRDNVGGETEFGLLLTFTLKDFPRFSLPMNLDPQPD